MSQRDYYEVLGVSKDADDATLKKAFRRLAMKYHPDRAPDDDKAESMFKEAKEAYDILSDSNKRAAYDQFGHAGVQQNAGGGAGGAGFRDIFDEVFGDIFSGRGGGGGERAYRGANLRYGLEIGLEEAVFGTTATIRVPSQKECELCHGSGAKPGTDPIKCTTCDGVGQVRMQQGFFSIQQTCPRCRGQGQIIAEPCDRCDGQGWTREHKTLSRSLFLRYLVAFQTYGFIAVDTVFKDRCGFGLIQNQGKCQYKNRGRRQTVQPAEFHPMWLFLYRTVSAVQNCLVQ